MVTYIRYGLRRGGGALQENMYVVRFRHLVVRQQKYNMRQWVASTALSSLVSCALFNCNFCRTVPDTAGCESILARWTPSSGSPLDMNAVIRDFKVGGNAWERRSQARHFCNMAFRCLKKRFSRGNARSQAVKIALWECNFSSELINLNLVWLYRNTGTSYQIKGAHRFFFTRAQ